LIGKRHTKRRQYIRHGRRNTLTSFRNIVNTKNTDHSSMEGKAVPQILPHLRIAE
jgi:hypothetical protein